MIFGAHERLVNETHHEVATEQTLGSNKQIEFRLCTLALCLYPDLVGELNAFLRQGCLLKLKREEEE